MTFFLFFCLVFGQLIKQFANWTGIPYTSLITVFGMILGVFCHGDGRFGTAMRTWSEFDPHLMLFVFLPALIFESAFNSDFHIFSKIFGQCLLLAGPILLGCTGLTAVLMKYILRYGMIEDESKAFSFTDALLYGAIVSATDPVAVVALLKELGAPAQLSTMIEGESLLNDGTAMVVFFVLLDVAEGKEFNGGEAVVKFIRLSGGGPILGIIIGSIVIMILKRIYNQYVLEVNMTICACYMMFWLSEFSPLHVSGILALVGLGFTMSFVGKYFISPASEHALHHVWGYVGFVAESLIFIVSGVIIGERIVIG